MGFHNVVLPAKYLSSVAVTGPGHKTYIGEDEEADSGLAQRRVSRWAQSRRVFDITAETMSKADAAELYAFVLARQGSAHSFLLLDPLDNTTAVDNSSPTNADTTLGTDAAGNRIYYEMCKWYAGERRYVRRLVPGSIVVARNGVGLTEGTDFLVDHFLGKVLIISPTSNSTISAGCQFYCKVRFDTSVDDLLGISADDFDQYSAGIRMVEDNTEVLWAEEESDGTITMRDIDRAHVRDERTTVGGGNISSAAVQTLTQTYQLKYSDGLHFTFVAGAAALPIYLPAALSQNVPPGGPHFTLTNGSDSNSAILREWTGAQGGASQQLEFRPYIRPRQTRTVWYDSDAGRWRAV